MNILVLGASGMAGHVIATYLKEQGYTVSTVAATRLLDSSTTLLDVTSIPSLKHYLDSQHFDAVINCIGLLIHACEQDKTSAISINAYLPHFLADYYCNTPTKVIHLSTDCVFSGENGPYDENARLDGSLFYDRTKALGEIHNHKDLTFRMSIIGPELNPNGIGLFNWFMQQQGEIDGFTNSIWNGITTLELANGIEAALLQNLTGIYHLVPPVPISKYYLLLLFNEIFNKDKLSILPKETIPLNKTLINTREDFNFKINNYFILLHEMKRWITDHPEFYKHYFS